jgi:predicted N-acetyltransferase YhbS
MIIKTATELNEFLQIHQLNYKTFVEEIPQHQKNSDERLVDKFHNKNKYIVAKKGEKVIGMVCYNRERPFSLDSKISDLDFYLPEHNNLVEIRLLSISKEERKTRVIYRLLKFLCSTLIELKIDAAVISGTTRELKLYSQIGFVPFGETVGIAEALYQPMFITLNDLRHDFRVS